MSRSQRRAMIDREEPKLSLVRQCALLGISRSSYLAFYNQERPHQALGYRSPGQVFQAVSPQRCLLEHPRALPSDEGLRDIRGRSLTERRRPDPLVASGGVDLILFCWERRGRTDLLVMVCKGVEARWRQLQRNPDRTTTIASSFVRGQMHPRCVPGRQLCSGPVPWGVTPQHCLRKAGIAEHAPWTEVTCFREAAGTPSQIRERIDDADIVIDTTGNEALAGSLAMVAKEMDRPLVSGALYRGGFIGRVERQVLPGDTPIYLREDSTRYPIIPAGVESEDFATPQLGCSAPVNNAPPASVLACASLIAQAAIDVLMERFEFEDEVIDVYRSLLETPFDHVGRYQRPVLKPS